MFKSSFLSNGIKNILIINSVLFILTSIFPILIPLLAAYVPENPNFRLYQLITHMFIHGSISHIFFNMFTLVIFGITLEKRLSKQLFYLTYILCGLGSYILQMMFTPLNECLIGASGAVFGIMTLYTLFYPNEKFYLLIIPIPIKIKVLFFTYIIIELLSINSNDNVGHYAHIGGSIVGCIMYFLIKKIEKNAN